MNMGPLSYKRLKDQDVPFTWCQLKLSLLHYISNRQYMNRWFRKEERMVETA